jgi:hypothetical protein
MRSAGLAPLSYRLRTELAAEAWHFNPVGRFSDAVHRQGYWTSSALPGPDPGITNGYRLPRRGNTIDQANDSGYSRLDDGSAATFWKSSPYLDPHFTGEPETAHPQWAMVDLGAARPVDAIRLDWALPYATRLRVQRWAGPGPPYRLGAEGEHRRFAATADSGDWRDFARGTASGRGSAQLLRLADRPEPVRWVRVLMTASSHTAPPGSADLRDRLGFALRELAVGVLGPGRRLRDWVRHAPSRARQSVVWVSSTDPWHRAADRDPDVEQPSLQRVLASGLAQGRPLLVPAADQYGTPADAAAEARFLRALHAPVRALELGEEPDGQLIGPEDEAALYGQAARAVRRAAPALPLGGPSLSTARPDWTVPPDAAGSRSWTGRFVAALRRRGELGLLGFFSFEWYPFDDVCQGPAGVAAQLRSAPALLSEIVARQRRDGLPVAVPLMITEYGYSPFAAEPEVDLPGALLDAEVAARFLAVGGAASFVYGPEPDAPMRESTRCATYGNLTLLVSDDRHRIRSRAASYWTMRMLTRLWTQPSGGRHVLYGATLNGPAATRRTVDAYPLRRPDGRLSILLFNRDPARGHAVTLRARGGRPNSLRGPLDVYRFWSARYRWRPRGPAGSAGPDLPALHRVRGGPTVVLPPYSLTVVLARAGA